MRTVSVSLAATMRALNDAGQLHSTVAQNLLHAEKVPEGDAVKPRGKRHTRHTTRCLCVCVQEVGNGRVD